MTTHGKDVAPVKWSPCVWQAGTSFQGHLVSSERWFSGKHEVAMVRVNIN